MFAFCVVIVLTPKFLFIAVRNQFRHIVKTKMLQNKKSCDVATYLDFNGNILADKIHCNAYVIQYITF